MTTPEPPKAPWKDLLNYHLSQNSSSEFTLATVAYDATKKRHVPRARVCGFRGFFPNPQLHPSAVDALKTQGDGLNPDVYESDMLSFTTDVRMEKVGHIQPGSSESDAGSEVEMVFWLKDAGSQWRIKGDAFVIGDQDGGSVEDEAREEIQRGLRIRSEDGCGRWTWERQVTTYFANHTPILRGSFKSPSPGRPKSQDPQDPSLKPGQEVEDLHDSAARKNFRVVVVRPQEVERLDLSDYKNPARWTWTLVEDGKRQGLWDEVELWP